MHAKLCVEKGGMWDFRFECFHTLWPLSFLSFVFQADS